jgi:PAS domain S-box-containing protein
VVVARQPNAQAFVGHPIVPALWQKVSAAQDGIARAPTLEGVPALAAFTHVEPFHWAIIAGEPENVLTAPLWSVIYRAAEDGALVLVAGLILATLAARQITGPIEVVGRLADRADAADATLDVSTGLRETDTVARALISAARERRNAVAALAESEERFRDVFQRSPSGTILADPETTQVIDCNEAAAAFVGYSVEAFRRVKLIDLRLQSSPERIRAICDAVLRGEVVRYEARVRGADGPRDLLIAVAPVRVSGRTLMLLSQLDVTELRAAEIGLRINEERLELARQGASLGIWDWDLVQDRLIWTDHQWHLHGLNPQPGGPSPEEWRRTLDPADADRVRQEIRLAVKQPGYVFATEYTVVLKNGKRRRLLARGQAIRNEDGRTVRLVGINMDVTARYEAELARDRLIDLLKAEQSRLSEIIDVLPVGVGIFDHSGRLALSNPTMRRFIGPLIPSMQTAMPAEWVAFHPDGRRLAPEEFPGRRALAGETISPGIEFLFRGGDGTERWLRVSCVPLRWADGEVQEVLAVLQDIDAERRLVDIQQQANLRLEQRVREEVDRSPAASRTISTMFCRRYRAAPR